jgi:hypothetical protein
MLLIPSAGGGLPDTEVLVLTRDFGTLLRATLGGSPAPPGGDTDGDGADDVTDNCPVTGNPGQADGGGVGSSAADGVGDLCQCGDVNGDGQVQIDDVALIERAIALLAPGLAVPDHCNVDGLPGSGAGTCGPGDATALREALAGAPLRLLCGPAQP